MGAEDVSFLAERIDLYSSGIDFHFPSTVLCDYSRYNKGSCLKITTLMGDSPCWRADPSQFFSLEAVWRLWVGSITTLI